MLTIPMCTATELVLAGPQDFLAAPSRWAQWISDFGGTISAGPNFSYALSARAMRRGGDLDLSRWRVALNGAEPIEPSSVESWLAAGAPHGLRVGAAFCAYGMAESTVAITFPEPGHGMAVDTVDRTVLETEGRAVDVDPSRPGARRLPFLGRAVEGLELRIVDAATGIPLHDREAGELEVRGTSVTPGYLGNERATADTFHDGWLRTGDLGYLVDGELVICGRLKDVIIVGGRNVFPEDIERAAATVEGVRAGNVIAFGTPGRRGRERVVVVAESRVDDVEPVRDAVASRIHDAVGVGAEVVLVTPGSLPKTSSGKLQRSLCKTRYQSDLLQPVAP
jgi:fatty-acyl-CoA synthase